jgi:hypothetical protein
VKPHQIEVGMAVEFSPRPGLWFDATIASEAWQLGGGQWVCKLTDLPREYRDGQCNVSAAALWCIRPRGGL